MAHPPAAASECALVAASPSQTSDQLCFVKRTALILTATLLTILAASQAADAPQVPVK
jgi:hypothetical protein